MSNGNQGEEGVCPSRLEAGPQQGAQDRCRRDVAAVFHAMAHMIKADLSKNGAGVFKVPGLMRITVKRKPATKARMGINPFTKEQVMFKAKPARNVVRVRPLKTLSQMV